MAARLTELRTMSAVTDLPATVRFCVEKLRFNCRGLVGDPPVRAGVERGLGAEIASRGVAVSDLRVTMYGVKELEVRDPEGHWLWFGQPTGEAPTVKED